MHAVHENYALSNIDNFLISKAGLLGRAAEAKPGLPKNSEKNDGAWNLQERLSEIGKGSVGVCWQDWWNYEGVGRLQNFIGQWEVIIRGIQFLTVSRLKDFWVFVDSNPANRTSRRSPFAGYEVYCLEDLLLKRATGTSQKRSCSQGNFWLLNKVNAGRIQVAEKKRSLELLQGHSVALCRRSGVFRMGSLAS